VSYVYNNSDVHALGFIAEEVAQVDGRPVVLDGEGKPYALDYDQIIPIVTQGMKELSFGLTNVNAPFVDEHNNKTFAGRFFDRLIAWLGDTANGIHDFFVGTSHQERLCVGTQDNETCITKDQLDRLLQDENISPEPAASAQTIPSDHTGSDMSLDTSDTSATTSDSGTDAGSVVAPESTGTSSDDIDAPSETPTDSSSEVSDPSTLDTSEGAVSVPDDTSTPSDTSDDLSSTTDTPTN
jgi:hypothetical protein